MNTKQLVELLLAGDPEGTNLVFLAAVSATPELAARVEITAGTTFIVGTRVPE